MPTARSLHFLEYFITVTPTTSAISQGIQIQISIFTLEMESASQRPSIQSAVQATTFNLPDHSAMPRVSQNTHVPAIVESLSATASEPFSPVPTSETSSLVPSDEQTAQNSSSDGDFSEQVHPDSAFVADSLPLQFFGPLPDWAYFYDPSLTLPQVEFVQSRMKTKEEYSKMRTGSRVQAEISDLSNAIHAMREAFGRTDLIVRSARSTTRSGTPSKNPMPAPQAKISAKGNTADNAIALDPSEDDESVDTSRSNLAGVNYASIPGKRPTSDETVQSKRQKTSQSPIDGAVGSDIPHESGLIPKLGNSGPSTPAEVAQYIEDGQRRMLKLAGLSEDPSRFEVARSVDGRHKILLKRPETVRWYDEETRIMVRWRDDGKSWDDICRVRPCCDPCTDRLPATSTILTRAYITDIGLNVKGTAKTHVACHTEKIL